MKKFYKYILISIVSLCLSCGGSDDGGDLSPNPNDNPENEGGGVTNGSDNPTTGNSRDPQPAELVFPLRDEVCNAGIFVSDTESDVEFRWQPAQNANSYTVVLTNLTDNTEQQLQASENRLIIRLLQDQSYSWSIISRSPNTQNTAESPTWRLYNAARGVQNHAPFPANVIAPSNGSISSVNEALNLTWEGSDPDNDIESFDVFFGEDETSLNLIGNTQQMTFLTPNIVSGGTYFWKISSRDTFGNITESQLFSFEIP